MANMAAAATEGTAGGALWHSYGEVGDFGERQVAEQRSSRKRKRNPSKWKVNNYERKPMRQVTECSCERECLFKVLSDAEVRNIRDTYREAKRQVQRQLLFSSVATKRSRQGARLVTTFFVLHPERGLLELCRKAFMSVYSISDKVVKSLLRDKRATLGTAAPLLQFDTPKKAHPREPALLVEIVKHINSFPREKNHYGRESGGHRQYLSGDLSVARMHQLYLEKYEPQYVVWERAVAAAKRNSSEPPPVPKEYEQEKANRKPRPKVLLSYYRDVLVTEFNLAFGRPINELCGTCHDFENEVSTLRRIIRCLRCLNKDDEEEEAQEEEDAADEDGGHDHGDVCDEEEDGCPCASCLDKHETEERLRYVVEQRRAHVSCATLAYDTMRHDQLLSAASFKRLPAQSDDIRGGDDDEATCVAAEPFVETLRMDYEKNYHCPRLKVPQWYYARNFLLYNLGIYRSFANVLYCTVFGEDLAARGQNATYSLLLDHLHTSRRKGEWLILWMDSCARQNKHYTAIHAMQGLIEQGERKRIDLKFPVVGHSFLPCDRIFGLIEKRRHLNKDIYVPEQWKEIVEGAAASVDSVDIRFNFVNDVTTFKDLDTEYSKAYSTTSCRTILGTQPMRKVNISEMFWINFGCGEEFAEDTGTYRMVSHPHEVWFKQDHDRRRAWIKCGWQPRSGFSAPDLADVPPQNTEKIPLKAEKIQDLLMMKAYVPEEYHWWYPAG
jgi:hypothetical protein